MKPNRRSTLLLGAAGALCGFFRSAWSFGNQNTHFQHGTPVESCVLVLLKGGLSHLDSFDPKPAAPSEIRGEFQSISTKIPGVHFCEHLPRLADRNDRFALLRGVKHKDSIHESGQLLVLSGVPGGAIQAPSLGACISAYQHHGDLPGHVGIPGLDPNSGDLGAAFESFNLLGNSGNLVKRGPAKNDEVANRTFQRRIQLLESFEEEFSASGTRGLATEQRAASYQAAIKALQSEDLKRLPNLDAESPADRERYGRNAFGNYLLLARRAIRTGVRFVTVVLADWDTHYENFPTLRKYLPELDRALAALIDDLADTQEDHRTLLCVQSEFGRTPQISKEGGRDHWPQASTAILMGPSIKPGVVHGDTDETGSGPINGNFSPSDLAHTILTKMGIDPLKITVPPTGRVLLPFGRTLDELG